MALTTTRNYSANAVLTEAQLDAAFDSIETFVNTTGLDATNIQDGAITGIKLNSNVVDNSTTQLSSNQIIVKSSGITATQLGSSAVTTAKIDDSAVTTAKINAGAVTIAKLGTANLATSSTIGTVATSSATFGDIAGLTVNITTEGRPVMISLIGSTSSESYIETGTTGASTTAEVKLVRSGTDRAIWRIGNVAGGATSTSTLYPSGTFSHFETVSAGTYTYKIQGRAITGTLTFVNLAIRVWEL